MSYPVLADGFNHFLSEVRRIQPLSPEREYELSVRYRENGDREAAQELIISHLPLVVKIAFRYRHYLISAQDLAQEGTVGLMKALTRFDPYKGYRLATFAIWWIKAYIKNFIIKSWNLVKLGTTGAQRKLFYRMGSIGEHPDEESRQKRIKDLAEDLHVREDDVIEMEARVKAREMSLDQAVGDGEGSAMLVDLLQEPSPNQERLLLAKETEAKLSGLTENAMAKLDQREQFIITKRFLEDTPWTLQELGNHFGTTRERMRQIEQRALGKLRKDLQAHGAEALLPA